MSDCEHSAIAARVNEFQPGFTKIKSTFTCGDIPFCICCFIPSFVLQGMEGAGPFPSLLKRTGPRIERWSLLLVFMDKDDEYRRNAAEAQGWADKATNDHMTAPRGFA
jgi:hypothetical protein